MSDDTLNDPPLDKGTLTGTPTRARISGPGLVMILGEEGIVWKSSQQAPLVPSMVDARAILAEAGYQIADFPDAQGTYAVTPVAASIITPGLALGAPLPPEPTQSFVGQLQSIMEDAGPQDQPPGPRIVPPSRGWLELPLNAEPTPDPLPPGARVAVPRLAGALPCAEVGDQIDTNRHHIAWAAWQWFMANREALAPLLVLPSRVLIDPPAPESAPAKPARKTPAKPPTKKGAR